jgi:hypothetical protein
MKPKFITILLVLLIVAPMVQAAEATLDTQYYGYLRDTCKKNNVERVWNRWFGDKQKDLNEDTCCMNAVAEMEKKNALIAENGACPENQTKNRLQCPTSKEWCEKEAL